jgi:hypothetical protein
VIGNCEALVMKPSPVRFWLPLKQKQGRWNQ